MLLQKVDESFTVCLDNNCELYIPVIRTQAPAKEAVALYPIITE